MTRNHRMPSSRKRKRPSGPNERCQRSASSQSSSDDNRSGGRGCGRIITNIVSVATSSSKSHHAPQAAIAMASQMANDLRPEHKLPSKDILVTPKPDFQVILKTVGADKSILTAREVLSYLIKYISSRKLYDDKDPKKVYCKNDPLGKVFGVDAFTIKDAKRLLFNNMTVINRGGGIPAAHISEGKKEYFTLVQSVQEGHYSEMILPAMKQRSDCRVQQMAPSTITEAMDSADGDDPFPKPDIKPRSNPNPLVMSAISTPPMPMVEVVPPPAAPVCQPAPVHHSSPRHSSPHATVSMDTAEDVKKATANVANLFRSVSLDVDPSQEGPSTAVMSSTAAMSTMPSIEDSPVDLPDKPGGKRNAKTRLPSEDSSVESKSKSPPSKSPPSQSDEASEGPSSTRQWVRLHYRPGEELKSVSSERLSVQDYETVVVADSSDDLWFVEQEEFEIEYSVGDSSEGAPSKEGSDDSSSETEVVFEVSPDDSSDSRWADDSSSTDTEISDQDKWDCIECQNRNPPVDRYCNRCWALRTGWLPDEQRMTLRERLLNQAKQLRRSNSAPAGNMAAPHKHYHPPRLELTTTNLTRHNNMTLDRIRGSGEGDADMEAMDTVEAGQSQAPIIFPGRSGDQCYQAGNDTQQYPSAHCKLPSSGCDRGYKVMGGMTCGNGTTLEVIPDDNEDDMELCPSQPAGIVGRDFPDGNEDKEATGRQVKTGEENGNDSQAGGNHQGRPPNPQDSKSSGGSGFPDNTGQEDSSTSPRHAFGQATFGQPSFGQPVFGHSPVINNTPPETTDPRIFGQDLEGYSPSAGPKPGGQREIIQQGHFKSTLSEASADSHHATCSASTLSPESELGSEKGSLNLNDPIARKRMKMDTQRQDSGLGLSQEFCEKSKVSPPDGQMCNDNYAQMHGNAPPPGRRRRSSTSEIDFGGLSQDSTFQSSGSVNHLEGAIESTKPCDASSAEAASSSQDGQTRVPDICGFCFKRPKNASIIHGKTGHQVCCYQCAKKLRRRGKPCPICRQSIQAVIKNFLV